MKRKKQILITLTLIILIVFVSFSDLFSSREAEGAWYTTGGTWTNRKKITVDNTKVSGSSNLTDFPMLVSVTDSDLRHTGSGGKVGKTDGTDILFTSADGTTKLSHEIEKYVSTTGELVAWVKIPTLSYNTDTEIYIYYGNSGAGDMQNITDVWNSNIAGVFHFPDGSTLSLEDSTSNNKDGTNSGTTASTGQINGASEYNGSSSRWTNTWAGSTGNDPWSISFWMNTDTVSASKTIMQYGALTNSRVITIGPNNTGKIRVNHYFNDWTSNVQLSINTWTYVVVTYSGGTRQIKVYKDGSYGDGRTLGANLNIGGATTHTVGRWPSGVEYYDGELDEYRIHTNELSSDWITTEYNNQSSPSTFYSISSEESEPIDTVTNISIRNDGGSISWYTTGGTWTNRKKITVDNTKVSGSSNLTDFPMLVSVTDSDLRHTGSGGKVGKTDGTDILFTSADGTTKLSGGRCPSFLFRLSIK